MLPQHAWQEKFKQHLPQRHFSSPFKVISQLSRGGHSDISIVHRHGEPIKMAKRKQFDNKAFPNITSTNWKAQRHENKVFGGIPNISLSQRLLIISSRAVKNWFYLTKIQIIIHLHFKINRKHENSIFCLECNNQYCYIGLLQLHFGVERFNIISKHLYFWQIHLL